MMRKDLEEKILRGNRRSPRTVQLTVKITPEFDETIRKDAYKEGAIPLAEMLEKYQKTYHDLKKN